MRRLLLSELAVVGIGARLLELDRERATLLAFRARITPRKRKKKEWPKARVLVVPKKSDGAVPYNAKRTAAQKVHLSKVMKAMWRKRKAAAAGA